MPNLLLILSLTAVPAFARTNNPELVSWVEFQSMSPVHQDQYLREVADAMAEFERASNEGYEDLFAANPYFRTLFERVLDEVVPRAEAAIADGMTCDNVQFYIPPGGGAGRLCVSWGGRSPRCTNPGGPLANTQSAPEVDAFVRKCHEKYQNDQAVVTAYNEYAKKAGIAGYPGRGQKSNTAGGQRPGIAPNDPKAAQTAGVAGGINSPDAGRSESSKNVGKLNKHCDAVSEADRLKARKAYRNGEQPECLIAGTISKYTKDKDGKSTCGHQSKDCTATNTYTSAGKTGKVPAGMRTMCQDSLYCMKDKKLPFCVQTSGTAFQSCQTAVDKNADKLLFGKDCVNGAVEKYRKLEESLTKVCDNDKSRSLLCTDCKNLKAKLDSAQSRNAPPGGAGDATGGAGAR